MTSVCARAADRRCEVSFHRENVVWQSEDGTWNRGFYTANEQFWIDDYDPEWDVDYDYSSFDSVSTGHPTKQAALDSWTGANPGGHTEAAPSAARLAELEAMARTCNTR